MATRAMATRATAITALLMALQGCSTSPRVDDHFGEAVRANLAAQVINPAASANANPATGMDGQAARAAHERYERSFKQSDSKQNASLISTMGK